MILDENKGVGLFINIDPTLATIFEENSGKSMSELKNGNNENKLIYENMIEILEQYQIDYNALETPEITRATNGQMCLFSSCS